MRPIYSISTKYYKFFYRNGSNFPFLSGDSFKSVSNCNSNYKINFRKDNYPSTKRIIFIKGDELDSINLLNKSDKNSYILIVGNSDRNYSKKFELPKFIKKAYLQNLGVPNDSHFELLPIGLENLSIGQSGRKKYFKPLNNFKYINKIIFPPMEIRNETRKKYFEYAKTNNKIFDVYSKYLNESAYFKLLGNYKFVFTSEGNGFDDHRIWESLYRNQIPIVIRGEKFEPFWFWTENLSKLELPILFVDSINDLNQEILNDFYARHSSLNTNDSKPLWMDYWIRKFHKDLSN